jgi:nucleoside-triphosphatase THEP1
VKPIHHLAHKDFMTTEHFLFVEKYRPKTLSDCILSDSMKSTMQDFVKSGQIPHLLFSGTPGTGKTTLAKALCNEIGADVMYINASNESGIDTIRNKVVGFSSVASFEGNLKVVILDECLSEDEKVRIGTVDAWTAISLKNLQRDVLYPVVSLNLDTGKFENDIGKIISDREDNLFEVTLDNGDTIISNDQHPFICVDSDGNFVQRTIKEGFSGVKVVRKS